jgi:hypothetical protein
LHDGAAQGDSQSSLHACPVPYSGMVTGSSRLRVATVPVSRRHDATRRRPWEGGGAARPTTSGSKARTQAG